jgi:hypothetical protein
MTKGDDKSDAVLEPYWWQEEPCKGKESYAMLRPNWGQRGPCEYYISDPAGRRFSIAGRSSEGPFTIGERYNSNFILHLHGSEKPSFYEWLTLVLEGKDYLEDQNGNKVELHDLLKEAFDAKDSHPPTYPASDVYYYVDGFAFLMLSEEK